MRLKSWLYNCTCSIGRIPFYVNNTLHACENLVNINFGHHVTSTFWYAARNKGGEAPKTVAKRKVITLSF